jgi:hypothetical protein
MKHGCQAIAEVHQESIQMPAYIIIIIPFTLDAETIICMMNKNLSAYLLWYTLKEQGFPEDFITDILKKKPAKLQP